MPYKCVNCSMIYEDGSQEILEGCGSCGRKFFFYIKKEKLNTITSLKNIPNSPPEADLDLNEEEKEKIEKDIREIVGINDEETPIFLDFESIKVLRHGKYVIDLGKLFSQKPKVYQLEDGKYIIDLSGFQKQEKKD